MPEMKFIVDITQVKEENRARNSTLKTLKE
jgi:hypothetical protein